jgi:hypothetical protein
MRSLVDQLGHYNRDEIYSHQFTNDFYWKPLVIFDDGILENKFGSKNIKKQNVAEKEHFLVNIS